MAKGPTYTDEEQKLLVKLAKKGGSPTVLSKEFLSLLPDNDRSEAALVQKIRKMILDLQAEADPESVPPKKLRAAKVNVAPISDAAPAAAPAAIAAADGSKTVRKPSTFIPTVNAALPAPAHGHNGNGNDNSDVISVDLGGLTLTGSKKRVGEALQQLG